MDQLTYHYTPGNYKYNAIGQMTDNVQDGHYFTYDVTGKVNAVYSDAAHASPIAYYTYDDKGFRVKKEDLQMNTTTWYVRDAAGSILAIYNGNELSELPVYGAGRLGVAYKNGSNLSYVYELADHLGNVRAVVQKSGSNALVSSAADYYPFGWKMPDRKITGAEKYRFGYQGQFAEEDEETGYNHFELRLYDSRVGRWLTTDPYQQHFSPYLSMGNNWMNRIDPNGGCDKDNCTCFNAGMLKEVTVWGNFGWNVSTETYENEAIFLGTSFKGDLPDYNAMYGKIGDNYQEAFQRYFQRKIDKEILEMQESIRRAQRNFVRNAYLLTAHEFNTIGEVSLYAAHATSYVPGLQPVSIGLSGVGTVLTLTGTGMNIGYYAAQRDFSKVALEASTTSASLLLRSRVKVGHSKGYLNNNIKLILDTKIDAYFASMKRIGNTAINKKRKNNGQ